MASKPIILLIPGSFSVAAMYYTLQNLLVTAGYDTYVNTLPSASRNPPELPASLKDDAHFFSCIIEKLVDQDKEIVLLGHSYGGLVASESAKGHSRRERSARGQRGGIVRLIFLTAIVLLEGQSVIGQQGETTEAVVKTDKVGHG